MNFFDSHSAVLADNCGFVRPCSLIANELSRGFVTPAQVFQRTIPEGKSCQSIGLISNRKASGEMLLD
jgi:hypothetical protein